MLQLQFHLLLRQDETGLCKHSLTPKVASLVNTMTEINLNYYYYNMDSIIVNNCTNKIK